MFEANEQSTFDDVLAKYEQFCKPRISVFAARHQILTMKQNNLTIDEFLTALKKQVRDSVFGDLKDDMVLHALTLGLDNDRNRRRLFETQKLTLDKAVNLCRLTEDTETEMRKMKYGQYYLRSMEKLDGDILHRFMNVEYVMHHGKGLWMDYGSKCT